MKFLHFAATVALSLSVFSCGRELIPQPATTSSAAADVQATGFPETFDSGVKGSYASGAVTLPSGSWTLDDALLGNMSNDAKTGAQSVRIRNVGALTMNFDVASASTVTLDHATFGSDGSSQWQLWVSSNGGSSFTQVGSTVTTSSSTLQTASFAVNLTGSVRFQVRKVSGGSFRLNLDNFSLDGRSGTPTPTQLRLQPRRPRPAPAARNSSLMPATPKPLVMPTGLSWA